MPFTSGLAEIKGNDAIVSLGVLQLQSPPDARVLPESGTLMHELGHNLNLGHGGLSGFTTGVAKPNYPSSMNYLYQYSGIPLTNDSTPTWSRSHPDFAHQPPSTSLYEASLDESVGIGPTTLISGDTVAGFAEPNRKALVRYQVYNSPSYECPPDLCSAYWDDEIGDYVIPPAEACVRHGMGDGSPIDWNSDGVISSSVSAPNANASPAIESWGVRYTDDWTNLFYEFQCQVTALNGAEPDQFAPPSQEVSWQQFVRQFGSTNPPRGNGDGSTGDGACLVFDVLKEHIDLNSVLVVRIVLYGSATLDVTKIVLKSVRAGRDPYGHTKPAGDGLRQCDDNHDGWLDLCGNFSESEIGVQLGDSRVFLHGSFIAGGTFVYSDHVYVADVPSLRWVDWW